MRIISRNNIRINFKIIALFMVMVSIFSGCFAKKEKTFSDIEKRKIAETALEIDLSKSDIIKFEDKHDDFKADGEISALYSIKDENFIKQLESKSRWKKLPLTDDNYRSVFMKITKDGKSYGPYVLGLEKLISEIENGYVLVKTTTKDHLEPEYNQSYSGYTVGVYDEDNKKLYYFQRNN